MCPGRCRPQRKRLRQSLRPGPCTRILASKDSTEGRCLFASVDTVRGMDENDEKQLRRELGRRFREARQAGMAGHRYTQGEVASALGKGVAAISAWETGRTLPDALAVRWMGQHYGVSADMLLALNPALPG